MMRAIHTDAPLRLFPTIAFAPEMGMGGGNADFGADDAADAFLKRWTEGAPDGATDKTDGDKQEKTRETPTDDEKDEKPTDESPEGDEDDEKSENETEENETDEDENDEGDKASKVASDDYVTKVKVDGKEVDVKVADLKRLFGQEAALTRKSQEVAEKRKQIEDEGAAYVARSSALLKRAEERFEPYAKIDWLVAAKELSTEELSAVRAEAEKAYMDVKFLKEEQEGFLQHVQQQRQSALMEEAKSTIKELQDPEKGIPNFDEKLYDEMRTFAVSSGIPAEMMNSLVSAPAYRIIHMAMMFQKGQKAVTTPVDKKPKKIIKSNKNSDTTRKALNPGKATDAMARLRREGTTDAASNAFLARWSKDDD